MTSACLGVNTKLPIAALKQAKELSKRRFLPPVDVALIYAELGDMDRAYQWLEKGYEDRQDWMAFLKVDPLFDPLRSDSRFHDLLRRMNLPP
jgi:serine/threonine-protein kinase